MPTNTLNSTFPATNYKVTLIHTNQNQKPTKKDVEKILFTELKIPVSSLTAIQNGFLIRTDISEHMDKITNSKEKFNRIHLTPRLPKTILAQRTLVIRHVDETITENNEEDIKREIEQNPSNNDPKIEQIIKLPSKTRTFKIICADI